MSRGYLGAISGRHQLAFSSRPRGAQHKPCPSPCSLSPGALVVTAVISAACNGTLPTLPFFFYPHELAMGYRHGNTTKLGAPSKRTPNAQLRRVCGQLHTSPSSICWCPHSSTQSRQEERAWEKERDKLSLLCRMSRLSVPVHGEASEKQVCSSLFFSLWARTGCVVCPLLYVTTCLCCPPPSNLPYIRAL